MKKEVLVLLVLVLSLPLASAVEIKEIFTIQKDSTIPSENGTKTYFYAGSKLIASKDSDNNIEYHHQDRLGSDIESRQLPFGQELIDSGNRFEFTGKELDDKSGLNYFGARYYYSNLGRFTSIDPVKDNHPYSYVANNPMNYVDPDGREVLVNTEIERDIIQKDLDLLVGEGASWFSENPEGDGFFVEVTDNYEGDYPETFALLQEIVERPEIVLLKVSSEEEPPHLLFERYDYESGELEYTDDWKGGKGKAFGLNVFIHAYKEGEFSAGGKNYATWQKHSFSGFDEVYYEAKDSYDKKGVFMPSYLVLAHELMGHALFKLREDPRYGDFPGKLDPGDPMSCGAGLFVERLVGAEHGFSEEALRQGYY